MNRVAKKRVRDARWRVIAVVAACLAGMTGLAVLSRQSQKPLSTSGGAESAAGTGISQSSMNPAERQSLSLARHVDSIAAKRRDLQRLEEKIGTSPPISADANPNTASIAEAAKTGLYPERLSPLFAPQPFDLESFQRDRQAYLDIHEPGRVFQSAQPGPEVPVIKPATQRFHKIKQGESVRLGVIVKPSMPVTFTSFDLGTFANGLTSTTVLAGEDGVASTSFTGSSGSFGTVRVLAASPATAGRIRFAVNVVIPRDTLNSRGEDP